MDKSMKRIYPYKKNGCFQNSPEHKGESFWLGTIPSFIRSLRNRSHRFKKEEIHQWLASTKPMATSAEPVITWVGHATFLIQLGGINIITDPIFGDASLIFKRVLAPGVSLQDLPRIDVVVISHNHYDHMDKATLIALKKSNPNIQILVPQGDKKYLDSLGFSYVNEYMWWEQYQYSKADQQLTCTFLPAWHWSRRGLFDRNKSLWGSWMITWQGMNIYFGGDTAYSPHFKNIAQEYSSIDIALMPIGPCEPRWWMKKTHMDSHDAVQAYLDLNAQQFVPMHWGTFPFGVDKFALPIERLKQAWSEKIDQKQTNQLCIVKAGQQLQIQTRAEQDSQSISSAEQSSLI